MQTKLYRQQHQRLVEQVSQLQRIIGEQDFSKHEAEITKQLAELSGVLKLHLKLEDDSFYPALRQHKDESVRKLAARYESEMGGLADAFTNYRNTWIRPGVITAEPEKFRRETKSVFAALAARITKEDTELYALVDKLDIVVTPSNTFS